jgi:hypothetical protein
MIAYLLQSRPRIHVIAISLLTTPSAILNGLSGETRIISANGRFYHRISRRSRQQISICEPAWNRNPRPISL